MNSGELLERAEQKVASKVRVSDRTYYLPSIPLLCLTSVLLLMFLNAAYCLFCSYCLLFYILMNRKCGFLLLLGA